MEPRADSLAVPFGARDLTGKVHRNPEALRLRRAQAQAFVQQARRVHERVAVHHAVARELGVLEPGDEAEHAALLREGEVRLEPHEVVAGTVRVLGTQLQRGPWAMPRARVGEPHRLERAEARRVVSLAGDLLDRLARLEQIARLEVAADHALGGHELVDEGVVLLARERRVQVVARIGGGVLVAALAEQLRVVERIGHDDRGGGVVEGQVLFAGEPGKRRGQRVGRERPCGHHERIGALGGLNEVDDLLVHEIDERMRLHERGHRLGERRPVDGQRTACGHGMQLGLGVQLRSQLGQLALQHAGRAVGLLAFQGVRAHEFGAASRDMNERGRLRAHFDQTDPHATIGELQGRLAPSEPGPYYGY